MLRRTVAFSSSISTAAPAVRQRALPAQLRFVSSTARLSHGLLTRSTQLQQRPQAPLSSSSPFLSPVSRRLMSISTQPTPIKVSAASKPTGADAIVIGVTSSDNGPVVAGAEAAGLGADRASTLASQLGKLGFKGKPSSLITVAGSDGDAAPVLIFAGLGDAAKVTPEVLRRAAGAAVRSAGASEFANVAVAFPATDAESLSAIAEGASLGAYTWTSYKSKDKAPSVSAVEIVSSLDNAAEVVRHAEIVAHRVKVTRDLVNTPPNILFPQTFAEYVVAQGQGIEGVTVEVWDEKKLAAENCGGIVGVGKGSINPPRLVKVAYTPANSAGAKHLAIVGKGITFDTGGISLKPSPKMHEMKADMGGAAATLNAVLAAAELKLPVRVTGWLCLAENMPGGAALKNGDVITHRTGTTVEIHNTDAEGRLVLADGLAVAQSKATGYGTEETDPDLLLNIATLTGAQIVSLGLRTAGLMGDEKAITAVQNAAKQTGEPFWAMPFPEEFLEDIKSTTADLKNIGSIPAGGMLKAGVFLQQFAGDKGNWAHLDIAGPSVNWGAPYGHTSQEGTGFGTRTLLKVAEQLA